ncbi:ATP-binding protein [Bacteroides sp. 519]|uniref:ATP-binding protein n=1 Tax=Bacteroides sp. 519 TaxID=2302937 RepID=UPI0013D4B7D9|nr:ATP-binding protein [Bacteroides sp. 519]NDV58485.1 hypothetical protein [Bacteroides sp. 519]
MISQHVKSIPYGISDYERISLRNYYYVDKTHFIPQIERSVSYFFLIRPRRFGKSLLLNMLDAYYDINNESEDRFKALFGERWIFQNPTDLRAKFLILRFNFSGVDTQPENMQRTFESHCAFQFKEFADRYERFFGNEFRKTLTELPTATDKLQYVNTESTRLGLRIYLIIDEYDNFTNSILANIGTKAYKDATHGEGFYRYFFNVLKLITTGNGMALERMFITGVSPVTLDDVTSGFNIGTNYTTATWFNGLVGFSEQELRTMLEYYYGQGVLTMTVDEIVKDMKPWYDNYCFALRSHGQESMYNSDMVLYYLNWLIESGFPPDEMVDKNIRTDYNKLHYLIRTDYELDAGSNLSVIREIIEKGYTTGVLSDGFSVDEMLKPDNFKSLLYYFGLVTIVGTEFGDIQLGIPNHTVREQMYTYLVKGLVDANAFSLDFYELNRLMRNMAYRGDWKSVFTYIGTELKKQSRLRQFMDGEAHVKTFILAYLGLTNYYQLMPEYEMGKGYADFYFRPNPRLVDIEYAYLLEVKYIKRADVAMTRSMEVEAGEQLLKYASDEIVTSTIGNAKLKLITVVFCGWEIVSMVEEESIT